MGEIKKYDEKSGLFERRSTPEIKQVKSLKVGEYWSEAHDCERANCKFISSLRIAALRAFGRGNYVSTHRNGIIAVLRKA